jgi:hypothetical protein
MSKRHKRTRGLRGIPMVPNNLIGPKQSERGPDFEQLLPTCNSAEIQAIQAWYASEFEKHMAVGREKLRAEIAMEHRAALLAEIAAVQDDLERKDEELTIKLADDAFPFSTILRLRTEKLELTSYLRGLSFSAAGIQVDQRDPGPYNKTAHCFVEEEV